MDKSCLAFSSIDQPITSVDQQTIDHLLEIRQIEYEQHLIREEMNRVDLEKQRLENLLYLLQATKSPARKKKTKRVSRPVKRS